jgi:hypothetical protein
MIETHQPSSVFMLRAIKIFHTIVWAFFASSIIAILVFAWLGRCGLALVFISIVLIEALVIIFNNWRCPLTDAAARYTHEHRDNFDIYLPEWLACHNKRIFGFLYAAGILFAFTRWVNWLPGR